MFTLTLVSVNMCTEYTEHGHPTPTSLAPSTESDAGPSESPSLPAESSTCSPPVAPHFSYAIDHPHGGHPLDTSCISCTLNCMSKRVPSELKKAVVYCRVSTGGQARDGVSLDAQEAACRAHAARLGLEVVGVHRDEGLSGKLDQERRPGLAAVIREVKAEPEAAVVVYSLSRLGRSQRMIWTLLDDRGPYRLRVTSVSEPFDTTTPMGRAFLGMLATFAQLESDLASERTADALSYVKSQGLKKLGAPTMLESVVDGRRILDPRKVALVQRVQRMRAEGLALREIADKLNAEKVPSVTGKKWHLRTVATAVNTEISEKIRAATLGA